MQENYLAKWLSGELTEKELQEFTSSEEYHAYKKLVDTSGSLKAPDFDVDAALQQVKNTTQQSKGKVVQMKPYKRVFQIAAVIAVLVTGSYFFVNSLDENVGTINAEIAEVVLPDSSEIILNASSQVSYNKKKWDKERNVDLEGEAFFKVAKGKKFTVSTRDGVVAVLGTQFNVENRKGYFEVACYEGIVSVTYQNQEIALPAGNGLQIIDGQLKMLEVTKGSAPSWIQKESSFTSTPLSYVLTEIERQFNITIEAKDINTKERFTGSFSNTDLNLALKSVSTPSQLQYTIEGNKVTLYAKDAQ